MSGDSTPGSVPLPRSPTPAGANERGAPDDRSRRNQVATYVAVVVVEVAVLLALWIFGRYFGS